ncbi:MAG: selenide, water dikinase SelD [candidate division Zixibacteria bacterium CG_4_9_14_3_um_filter_46_8]|nr:MAG: selenide, water dikinase SelD [candidate division Zixibacteria bacterium CG_4_9_14_3_um_filter_46_8]
MPEIMDPNVLVGTGVPDDAGVYRINDHLALVLTTDFFTPVVDDPYDYGRIAAANSLSDIYAMGGTPLTALNIVGFPAHVPKEILNDILRGGNAIAREAGISIIGGHTIKNPEPIYGLAVTGTINPKKIITKRGAMPGDVIILTKPLGTGILTTALKKDMLNANDAIPCIESMVLLNKDGCEAMCKLGVSAATDITGYGLLGHLYEIAEQSDVTININFDSVPIFEKTMELAKQSIYPGGSKSNFDFVRPFTLFHPDISFEQMIILCDAQTSGGLAIVLPRRKYMKLMKALLPFYPQTALVGEVEEKSDWRLRVQN